MTENKGIQRIAGQKKKSVITFWPSREFLLHLNPATVSGKAQINNR
jgi:hypothetical protein